MINHEIHVDRARPLRAQPDTGHNRWHPDIPPVLHCQPGDDVVMETRDAIDGAITPDSTVEDLVKIDLNLAHPLTGPVYVEGAEPGDVLVAEILEITPTSFGFTLQLPGLGFLQDEFPDPYLVKWDLDHGWATSKDLPGVRLPGAPFMGVVGLAPSHELMRHISAREQDLPRRDGFALLPEPAGAVTTEPIIARQGLRTIPPRENGGNIDIEQLTAGTRLLLPVWVDGALFSAGDAHFAQGDGQTCGAAIEMAATLRVRFDLRKGQATRRGVRTLAFERDGDDLRPELQSPRRFFATTGISAARHGENGSENLALAARNALLTMIDHLGYEYGYTRQQAYAICSVAVDLKVSDVAGIPNLLVSAFLPLDIFG